MEIAVLTDIHHVMTLLFQLCAAVSAAIIVLMIAIAFNTRRQDRVLLVMNDTWRPNEDADRAQHMEVVASTDPLSQVPD